jgi:hypothetical protein
LIDTCRLRVCLHDVLNCHVMSGDGGMRVSPRIPSTRNATSST